MTEGFESARDVASDPLMCRTCGGRCCQGQPGLWSDPQRFARLFFAGRLPPRAELTALLPALGLELRLLLDVPVPAPRRTDAGCLFLAAEGCTLPPAQRPDQCLALVPHLDTLLEGEMRCQLPPGCGAGAAHERWSRYWAERD